MRLALKSGGMLDHARNLTADKIVLLDHLQNLKQAENTAYLQKGLMELQAYLRECLIKPSIAGEAVIQLDYDCLREEIEQIASAQTLERARYYLNRLEKGITSTKTNRINDINLNRWKEYREILTDSLWLLERRDGSGMHTAEYWGNFVPQIPRQMQHRYTKKGEWVLDTFAGSGTTLIESQRMGRNAIGIELQPQVAERANKLISAEPNPLNLTNQIINADSATVDYTEILEKFGQKSVQLLIMHPPYFDIIKFSNDARDLSNAESIPKFLEMIEKVLQNAAKVLDKNRYLALVIGDKYAGGEWIPLGFLTMNKVQESGFSLKSIIVKNFEDTTGKRNQKELWKYRALMGGFYIFKHEYIFVFKKR
jgi:DNA modification methylase